MTSTTTRAGATGRDLLRTTNLGISFGGLRAVDKFDSPFARHRSDGRCRRLDKVYAA